MVDVGDRLSRERIRKAISDAEIALGLALLDEDDVDCERMMDTIIDIIGPTSELVQIRKLLAKTIDIKGSALWLGWSSLVVHRAEARPQKLSAVQG